MVAAMLALGRNHEALLLCFVLAAALAGEIVTAEDKRRYLHDSRGEGIGYRSRFCANASDVVHQESVIADSPTNLSHRVENVAILYTERRIGRCVVAGAGQHGGRATGKSRCRR